MKKHRNYIIRSIIKYLLWLAVLYGGSILLLMYWVDTSNKGVFISLLMFLGTVYPIANWANTPANDFNPDTKRAKKEYPTFPLNMFNDK